MHPARLLRVTSVIEACTWAFLIASIVVRATGHDELGGTLISWAGSLHGTAFVAYLFAVIVATRHARWPWWALLLGAAASVPPFCTLAFDWFVHRRPPLGRRLEAGPDQPDAELTGVAHWTATHPLTLAGSTIALFAFVLTSSLGA
ncbi:DUF3817 domain-containing protein [Gulosibacter faecalis]|uniref:DUF3817 domain-containing protein n=1 Tax=Gulosibacter faecalis TaxID=272240 RepID=A0ABW5UVA4_9MICO|nr:DUF3817 domain-containing protein [Gulosibacter faecalis]